MYILICGDYDEVIAWSLNGRAIVIKDTEEFVKKILPTFFKQSKFASFTRKMRRWGFSTRCLQNSVHWAFQHPHFTKAGGFASCTQVMTADAAHTAREIVHQMTRVNAIDKNSGRNSSSTGAPLAPGRHHVLTPANIPMSSRQSQTFSVPEQNHAVTSEWLRAAMYASARNNNTATASASSGNISHFRMPQEAQTYHAFNVQSDVGVIQRRLACLRESMPATAPFISTYGNEPTSMPHSLQRIMPINMPSINASRNPSSTALYEFNICAEDRRHLREMRTLEAMASRGHQRDLRSADEDEERARLIRSILRNKQQWSI